MAKNLVIVESPAKCKTISKFLDKDFELKASMGHIRDLPKGSMGIEIDKNFKIKYVTDKSKSKIIKALKNSAEKAKTVYLASDHDREGEAIAWHLTYILKNQLKNKDIYRITFNEITKNAIKNAIKNPGQINLDMVNSQQARRVLDRLVGYSVSPLLWKVISKGLSAGRVQSAALRIVCEKDAIIKDFIPKEFWTFDSVFEKRGAKPFRAELTKFKGKKLKIDNEKNASQLLNTLKDSQAKIKSIITKEKKHHPLPPFITSSLQQAASTYLNFSPKKTMMVAQKLYEGINIGNQTIGLITYMRTDSFRMAKQAIDNIKETIKTVFGKEYLAKKTNIFKNKKRSQDAHEAIRPTNPSITPQSIQNELSVEQFKLYNLIWQRAIATQMSLCIVDSTKIDVAVGEAIFEAKGATIKSDGFSKCYTQYKITTGEILDLSYKENDVLIVSSLKNSQKFTKPPPHYSAASLVKELETLGIGRPSTYASTISTIVSRNYVKTVKKSLIATNLGFAVNSFLIACFDSFFNSSFTSDIEQELDNIELGKTDWKKFLTKYYNSIYSLIVAVDIKKAKNSLQETTDIICDKCGNLLIKKWGKMGEFLACSAFPKCRNIKNFIVNKDGKIEIKDSANEIEFLEERCPKCSNQLLIKKGKFGRFIACSNFPKCKFTKSFSVGVKCPKCDGDIVERGGKKGTFYSCSNYPKCKFAITNKPINLECPICKNGFIVELPKESEFTKQCPNCKEKFK